MKPPPIPQKEKGHSQNEQKNNPSEGQSLAPPAFQLKADEPANGDDSIKKESGGSKGHLTITDGNALLRSAPPALKSLGTKIPKGVRVEILEEIKVKGKPYIRVKDIDTGAELGWTSKGNASDLDQKYKPSKASYTYHVDGHDLLVFLPKGELTETNVNVFMFFHGRGGDYTTDKTHAKTNSYADNPAISGNIPEAVSNSGSIAICPQGHGHYVEKDWGAVGTGGYQKMVSTALAHLSTDLGLTDKPLTAGNISLAGHSAGGNALGQAAVDTGATDVTLQEAGYNFNRSWKKLREWFLTGQAPKTMRVITQNNGNRHATRRVVKEGKDAGMLSTQQIVTYSKELVKAGKLDAPVTVEEFQGDGKVEEGGIVLERGYRVLRSDGSLQGSMRLYHLEDEKADHWAASSQTMETSMTSGAKDRTSDQEAMNKK